MNMDIPRKDIVSAAGKAQKKTDSTKHTCLVPGCSRHAILSHSQQRGGQLRAIARNSEVYAVEKNLYRALKKRRLIGTAIFSKIPIKHAATFPGYCDVHDSVIFSPIEKKHLKCNNAEQAALLFLRAHSFEYLQKKRVFIWNTHFLRETKGLLDSEVIENYRSRMAGIYQYLKFDAPFFFEKLFNALAHKEFDGIESSWVNIPVNLMVSLSCCMSPLMGRHIEYMEKNPDNIQPMVSFSVVPNISSTHVVVSWLREHSDLSSWMGSMLCNSDELEDFINQCIFGESEDVCISPFLWESLSDADQCLLAQAVSFTRGLEMPALLPRVVRLKA